MIERLPRYAEVELQRLCAKGGALCHSVDEDESGWDRLIEFPEMKFSGAIDTRPPRSIAYVQVKSARSRKYKVQLKLSNALRAAQSPQPWFILLLTTDSEGNNPKLYAIHVWGHLIEKILKAARQSEIDGVPLHKNSITFTFQKDDEKDDTLIDWMQKLILEPKNSYENEKIRINRTTGYEGGRGEALMSLEAKSEDEILENFLGLGKGLNVNSFTFTPSRFGIPASQPSLELSEGTVHIQPEPFDDIEFRLRSAKSEQPITLHGKAYSGPPGTKILRFSADFIDLIWRGGTKSEFRINIDSDKKYDIAIIGNFVKLMHWCESGPIDLQIWFRGKRSIIGTLNSTTGKTDLEWKSLVSILQILQIISGMSRIELSIDDICKTPGLKTIAEVIQAPSLRIEFMPHLNKPNQPLKSIVYWADMMIGNVSFCVLVENFVADDIIINDGKRQLTSKKKSFIEYYTTTCSEEKPGNTEEKLIEIDYKIYMETPERAKNSLGLGNIYDFLLECQNQNSVS